MLQRNQKEFEIPFVEIPKESEDNRFVKSFLLEEKNEIKEFFDEYGFVVVRDIFSPQECHDSINDIWNYLEQKRFLSVRTPDLLTTNPIDRSDPSTWGSSWPGMAEEGILGSPPVFTKQSLLNRINPKLYSFVSFILNRNDLLVNHDRYGLFRPTKNVDFGDGEIKDVSYWKTFYNVHLDANPWHRENSTKFLDNLSYRRPSDFIAENNEIGEELHIQGLVNFAENLKEDGGFHIVPSFHKYEKEWTNSTKNTLGQKYNRLNNFIVLPESSCVQKLAQRVTMRAGSVILWSQRVAHGSSPNDSSRARYAQFFKFFGASPIGEERMKARIEKLKEKVKDAEITDEELGDLGMKLFGFKKWE